MNAVILTVAPEESLRLALDDVLSRRCGLEYTQSSPPRARGEGLERLAQYAEESVLVEIVIAPLKIAGDDGIAFIDAERCRESGES